MSVFTGSRGCPPSNPSCPPPTPRKCPVTQESPAVYSLWFVLFLQETVVAEICRSLGGEHSVLFISCSSAWLNLLGPFLRADVDGLDHVHEPRGRQEWSRDGLEVRSHQKHISTTQNCLKNRQSHTMKKKNRKYTPWEGKKAMIKKIHNVLSFSVIRF